VYEYALIADNKLRTRMNKKTNPWIKVSFKMWHLTMKMGVLNEALRIIRWCAFDSDFIPKRTDKRFHIWAKLEISSYRTLFNQSKIQNFDSLKEKFGLNFVTFIDIFQVSHYIESKIKPGVLARAESGIIKVFLAVSKAQPCDKVIFELNDYKN